MSRSTERSPLLKSSDRAYSQSSSREEARPIDLDSGDPLASTTVGSHGRSVSPLVSYQHGAGSATMAETHAPILSSSPGDHEGDEDDERSPLMQKGLHLMFS